MDKIVNDILIKLAKKKEQTGDKELALELIKHVKEKCDFCGKNAGAMKRRGKTACEACGKIVQCSLKGCRVKAAFGEMVKHNGKPFCCNKCVKSYVNGLKNIKKAQFNEFSGDKEFEGEAFSDYPGEEAMLRSDEFNQGPKQAIELDQWHASALKDMVKNGDSPTFDELYHAKDKTEALNKIRGKDSDSIKAIFGGHYHIVPHNKLSDWPRVGYVWMVEDEHTGLPRTWKTNYDSSG